jgi:SsrA-binding protein
MEINNRHANYDYYIEDTYEAGMVLKGTEIKSIRKGSANLKDSYAIIKKGEVYLLNMYIAPYEEGNRFNHAETRTRKLLLNKNEIRKLSDKIQIDGYTLVPLKLYFKKDKAKILLGLGKGKKNYDKRAVMKERDLNMEARKAMHQSY